jgi:cyclic di-GMP phosphodiesterase
VADGDRRVLIVEDDGPVRSLLTKFLAQEQFAVQGAVSAEEALRLFRTNEFDLMLCDIRLPGMSGVDLVPEALRLQPDLAILMLTAVSDAATATLCLQRGAMDFITKPVEMETIGRAVNRALVRRDQALERRDKRRSGKKEAVKSRLDPERERELLEQTVVAALETLVSAYEAKDQYLRGHSIRIADLSTAIAVYMELDDEEVTWIRHAARLHDLGKIGIREDLLDRQGPLTPAEFEQVKQHVVIGAEILGRLAYLGDASGGKAGHGSPPAGPTSLAHLSKVIAYVRSHHERWDGAGYPDGLKGEQIPLGGRIIGVAEIYDAITTPRPYQGTLTPDQALKRMQKVAGTQIDPRVFAALVGIQPGRSGFINLGEPG